MQNDPLDRSTVKESYWLSKEEQKEKPGERQNKGAAPAGRKVEQQSSSNLEVHLLS